MNRRTPGWGKWLCLLCFLQLPRCEAGSIRLLNGESHNGKLAIAGSGLSVAEGSSTATFDLASILFANFGDGEDSELASLPAGVVLNNGSFVVGAPGTLDGSAVQLGNPAQPITVQRSAIAAVVFSPSPHATIYRILHEKTGAVLSNGDFFEAEFAGIKEHFAVVDSPLFGPQRFAVGSRLSAVILHVLEPGSPRYEIVTKNGSRFFSTDVKTDRDGLLLVDPILGQVKVGEGDLVELRAASGRYQLLTDLKPVAAVAASGADATASVSINDEKDGLRALSASANVAVSYAIPPGLTVFTCRITLSQESPPSARLVFSVFCDGKPVFRSSPISPGMTPQNLRVSLGTAQRMTLRAEPAMPGANAGVGKWISPMLLRQ